jgi:hypothetical protein
MQPAPVSQPPVSSTSPAPLRPETAFGVGRVIARTFSTWRRHVVVFSLLTLVADLPVFAVGVLAGIRVPGMTAPSASPFDPAGAAAMSALPQGIWLAYLATMLLFLVEVGAMTHGVIQHLAGKPVSLGAMIATGFRRLVPVVAVGLFCYLIFLVGLVLLLVPGIILACALAVAIPAVVVERPGVFGAIKRSFALTKGKRFAIFVAFLVLFLIVITVTTFGSFVLPALTASISPMLGTIVGLVFNIVFGTLVWVAPAVVYHDLRVAKEGVQTAQLAAIFE